MSESHNSEPTRKLRPHQVQGLEAMHNGAVLVGGVGSGKTRVALAYYVREVCGGNLDDYSIPMRTPKRLVIITTAKKRDKFDWEDEALHFGLFRTGGKSYGDQEFVVDSWNNIDKYRDDTNTFFIFDEQRAVGSGAWVKAFIRIAKGEGNEWIMLSATPGDTWMDYIPLFVAHGFYRNRTHFIEEHVKYAFRGRYREIRGFYGVRHLDKLRSRILVEMPFERHTTRHVVIHPVNHDETVFQKVWRSRWNVYEDVPLVDVAEMHRVGRKVVNSHPSRIEAIEELWEKHPRMIVFYNFDYELEMLRMLGYEQLGDGYTPVVDNEEEWADRELKWGRRRDVEVAEWNGHKHQEVPKTDKWLYLVQYQAGAEGWNCITTDTIVFYSLTYSHKLFEQAQGRTDRLNTPFYDLWYYVLMSSARIDKLIWKALRTKKNFHEGRNTKFSSPERNGQNGTFLGEAD